MKLLAELPLEETKSRAYALLCPCHKLIAQSYTCQLFLRYRREIFILGVQRFLKTTRSFPKIPDEVRSLPKNPEAFPKRPKSQSQYKRELAPSTFHFKNQKSRERYCHLLILHMVFVPYMGLSWHIFGNCAKQDGSNSLFLNQAWKIGPRAGVSRREIEVFNLQAWESRLRRESWQVYKARFPLACRLATPSRLAYASTATECDTLAIASLLSLF